MKFLLAGSLIKYENSSYSSSDDQFSHFVHGEKWMVGVREWVRPSRYLDGPSIIFLRWSERLILCSAWLFVEGQTYYKDNQDTPLEWSNKTLCFDIFTLKLRHDQTKPL